MPHKRNGEIATFLTLGLVILGGLFVLGSSFLVKNNKIASNSRAAGCTAGVSIGGGFYSCGAGCGATTGGSCPSYTHNSQDSTCASCNGIGGGGGTEPIPPGGGGNLDCPDPGLSFACCVQDNYNCSDGSPGPRYRWYGCTGQPCVNTKIKQQKGMPGTLVTCQNGVGPGNIESCKSAVVGPNPGDEGGRCLAGDEKKCNEPSLICNKDNICVKKGGGGGGTSSCQPDNNCPNNDNKYSYKLDGPKIIYYPNNTCTATAVSFDELNAGYCSATANPPVAGSCSAANSYGCKADGSSPNCPGPGDNEYNLKCGTCNRATKGQTGADGKFLTYRCLAKGCIRTGQTVPNDTSLNSSEDCTPEGESAITLPGSCTMTKIKSMDYQPDPANLKDGGCYFHLVSGCPPLPDGPNCISMKK